jgi:predicted PhzF superfamily epimerase YddE/YHI9
VRPGRVEHDLCIRGALPAGSPVALEVRAVYPQHGFTVEDPVTGSLNASAAGWLIGSGRLSAPYTAAQGAAIGRAGRIEITRDADGTVWTGGRSMTVIAGTVDV